MEQFLFIFRSDPDRPVDPEQMEGMPARWQNWLNSIAAQNKLADRGSKLRNEGRIVKPGNLVTDGPFTESKELVCGYIVVEADTLDEATQLAYDCPIFSVGGNVEVRNLDPLRTSEN